MVSIGEHGKIVKVHWMDATQHHDLDKVNVKDPSSHLSKCETVGELIARDSKALIVVYHYSDVAGVDMIVIPNDWVTEVEELCITENLESPQESQDATESTNSKNT